MMHDTIYYSIKYSTNTGHKLLILKKNIVVIKKLRVGWTDA